MFEQLGLIGCGLMGGSFARALRRAGLVKRIVGYSKSAASSAHARQIGIIDHDVASAAQAVVGADVVLIAVPVAATESTFAAIQGHLKPHVLVMDVGSTKSDVVEAGHRALGEYLGCLVGAHPIAGKEVAGVQHADADLYTGKKVILTPTASTYPAQLSQAVAVWTALGSRVLQMSPDQHDAALASVSHLPHLLAFAAVNAIAAQAQGAEFLALAGPGFRDFSRIAASDPDVWRDILHANRSDVLLQLGHFKQALAQFEAALQTRNASDLHALIAQASQVRAAWLSS